MHGSKGISVWDNSMEGTRKGQTIENQHTHFVLLCTSRRETKSREIVGLFYVFASFIGCYKSGLPYKFSPFVCVCAAQQFLWNEKKNWLFFACVRVLVVSKLYCVVASPVDFGEWNDDNSNDFDDDNDDDEDFELENEWKIRNIIILQRVEKKYNISITF